MLSDYPQDINSFYAGQWQLQVAHFVKMGKKIWNVLNAKDRMHF